MPVSRTAWQALRLAFSLGLVALVASRVDLGQMARVLAGADLRLVVLAWLLALGSWVVASYKWRLLLRALGADAPVRVLLGLNLVGLFYSLFLPGQLGGEVVKGIKLARYGVSGAKTAVTIGVDRLTGVVALALLALGGLALAPETAAGPGLKLAALGVLLASLAPLAVLLPASWVGGGLRLGVWLSWGPARSVLGLVGALANTFLQYRRAPGTLAAALVLSLAIQCVVVAVNYLAALGLGVAVPFLALTWIVALASILHLVPLSLAGLGVREGAYVVLLQGYGVSDAEGLGLALVVFGVIMAQGLVGGVIDLVQGLRLPRHGPAPDGRAMRPED
ncbi:MAG: flippase-like domain-containing protein [Chloroflexi bacterium]|nr:flippase-like domain-containing protein [Chloroflexota bacterium]